jgi:hypothetical protein
VLESGIELPEVVQQSEDRETIESRRGNRRAQGTLQRAHYLPALSELTKDHRDVDRMID